MPRQTLGVPSLLANLTAWSTLAIATWMAPVVSAISTPTRSASTDPSTPQWTEVLTIFEDQTPNGRADQPLPWVNASAPQGGELKLATTPFDSLHPWFLQGKPVAGLSVVHATLMKDDPEQEGVCYPYVAQAVRVDPDRVSFRIRPTARFQDGKPITADDVAFSFHFITRHSPAQASYYDAVAKAQVSPQDPSVVTFFLKPDSPKETALILGQLSVISKAYYSRFPDTQKEGKALLRIPVGSGPYQVQTMQPGRFVLYQRVKKWWGDDLPIQKGFYNFRTIRYDAFMNPTIAFEAFKKGDIHVHIDTAQKNWHQGYAFPAVQEGRVIKESWPTQSMHATAHIFNTRRPLLQDIRVRKAMALMMPFDEMNRALFYNQYQRAVSIFQGGLCQAKGLPDAKERAFLGELKILPADLQRALDQDQPPAQDTLGYEAFFQDPADVIMHRNLTPAQKRAQAIALLQSAGYVLRSGRAVHPARGPLEFSTLITNPTLVNSLEYMRKAFAAIGVTMTIRTVDPIQYMALLRAQDFDMVASLISASSYYPGNELVSTMHSRSAGHPSSHNLAGIRDPHVDAVIQAVLKAKTADDLKVAGRVLDRLILSGHYGLLRWMSPWIHVAYWKGLDHPRGRGPNTSDKNSWPQKDVHLHTWWAIPGASAP